MVADTSDEDANLPDDPIDMDEEIVIPQRPGIKELYKETHKRQPTTSHKAVGLHAPTTGAVSPAHSGQGQVGGGAQGAEAAEEVSRHEVPTAEPQKSSQEPRVSEATKRRFSHKNAPGMDF